MTFGLLENAGNYRKIGMEFIMLESIEEHPTSLNQGMKRSLDGSPPSTPMKMKGKASIYFFHSNEKDTIAQD